MNITVHYLFSKNSKIGSKIISNLTQYIHPNELSPSHVAILINNKYVFESTLNTGIRLIKYNEWIKHNTELKRLECLQNWSMEKFKKVLRKVRGKKYDYPGVLYLGYRLILNKLFRIKIPEKNIFDHKYRYFCCEAVGNMTRINYEMTTPIEVMYNIQLEINKLSKIKEI